MDEERLQERRLPMLGSLIGPPRASLLRALAAGEKSVGELVEMTTLSQPNISNHLARLKQQGLVQRRRVGRKVYYSLIDRRVRSLIGDVDPSSSPVDLFKMKTEYLAAINAWNVDEAERIVLDAASSGAPWQRLYLDVLLPSIEMLREDCEEGVIAAREKAAAALSDRVMARLVWDRRLSRTSDSGAPGVVVAGAPDEHRAVAARMSADFLQDAGWRVLYLGVALPTATMIEAIAAYRPRLVLISVTTDDAVPGALDEIRTLKARADLGPLELLVGGRASLRNSKPFLKAGASGVARDPADAAHLASRLLPDRADDD